MFAPSEEQQIDIVVRFAGQTYRIWFDERGTELSIQVEVKARRTLRALVAPPSGPSHWRKVPNHSLSEFIVMTAREELGLKEPS